MAMFFVVPGDESFDPLTRSSEALKGLVRKVGSIFQRPKYRLRKGIVVADARSRKRLVDTELLKCSDPRRALHGRPVVRVQHRSLGVEAFGLADVPEGLCGEPIVLSVVDLPSDDFSTPYIQEEVKVEERATDG